MKIEMFFRVSLYAVFLMASPLMMSHTKGESEAKKQLIHIPELPPGVDLTQELRLARHLQENAVLYAYHFLDYSVVSKELGFSHSRHPGSPQEVSIYLEPKLIQKKFYESSGFFDLVDDLRPYWKAKWDYELPAWNLSYRYPTRYKEITWSKPIDQEMIDKFNASEVGKYANMFGAKQDVKDYLIGLSGIEKCIVEWKQERQWFDFDNPGSLTIAKEEASSSGPPKPEDYSKVLDIPTQSLLGRVRARANIGGPRTIEYPTQMNPWEIPLGPFGIYDSGESPKYALLMGFSRPEEPHLPQLPKQIEKLTRDRINAFYTQYDYLTRSCQLRYMFVGRLEPSDYTRYVSTTAAEFRKLVEDLEKQDNDAMPPRAIELMKIAAADESLFPPENSQIPKPTTPGSSGCILLFDEEGYLTHLYSLKNGKLFGPQIEWKVENERGKISKFRNLDTSEEPDKSIFMRVNTVDSLSNLINGIMLAL